MKNRMNELVEILNKANIDYYINDMPSITDQEYDKYLRELINLEKKYPELKQTDSPTNKVGSKVTNNKITHKVPMISLSNVFNEEEITNFDKRIKKENVIPEYVLELKIDGLAISLIYENGNLIKGVTRGDGIVGEDITENVKTIEDIPKKLTEPINLEVRGEIYMSKSVFEKLNEERLQKNEPLFANPRNAASGSVRQLNPLEVKRRKLSNFMYHLIDGPIDFKTHFETLEYIKKLGFNVNENIIKVDNIDNMLKFIKKWTDNRNNLPYEIDGIVIKLNNLEDQTKIGTTIKYPKWATAYKFPSTIALTKLIDIHFSVGRTGQITPNAILEPTLLMGSIISRATLHNEDYVMKKDIRKNDIVSITKAGDIIPEVIDSLKSRRTGVEQPFVMATICPICKESITKINDSAAYYCVNKLCPAKKIEELIHFASRKAMNIDGLGERIIEELYNENYLTKIEDFYNLYQYKEEIKELEGYGDKKIDNIISNVDKSKNQPLHKLLFSLGIRHVGEKTAKIIANNFNNIDKLINIKANQLSCIDNIGEVIALSIEEYFNNEININLINKLKEIGVNTVEKEKDLKDNSNFKNQSFVITGTLDNYSRDEVKKIIEENGGIVNNSISSKTNVLIAGDKAGSKLSKAVELQVEIWTEEQFTSKI